SASAARPRGRWAVRALKKLALLAVSLLVALALIEAGTRVLGIDAPLVWEPHPELGWHHIPGARKHWTEEGDGQIVVNSEGFRDRERPAAKPAGTSRVVLLGDSMTEGVQVNLEQTFGYLLEEKLSTKEAPVQVFNCGVNGYGPVQE